MKCMAIQLQEHVTAKALIMAKDEILKRDTTLTGKRLKDYQV